MRKLVPLRRLLEDIEAEGLDPDQVFVDPDDIVELEEESESEED